MCKCHEEDFNCNQGRDCPAEWDAAGVAEEARSGARMIGLFLVTLGCVAALAGLGRLAGWW